MRYTLSALRRLKRGLGQTSNPGGIFGPSQDQIKIAGNYRQKVIEIVRNAAGQLADDFHPLDLAQRCLDDLASIDFCLRRSHGAVSGNTASERYERQKH